MAHTGVELLEGQETPDGFVRVQMSCSSRGRIRDLDTANRWLHGAV